MESVIKSGKQTGEKIESFNLKSLSVLPRATGHSMALSTKETGRNDTVDDELTTTQPVLNKELTRLIEREAKIIQKAEQQANEIVAAAQKEARHIVEDAIAKANEIELQASEEGLSKGIALGQEHFNALINSTEQLIDVINGLKNPLDDCQLQDIMQFSIAIAKKVVKTELSTNPEVIINNIKDSLNRCQRMPKVTIKINPEEAVLVNEQLDAFRALFGIESLTMISDPAISRGGCCLDTDMGNVDASIKTQLREIARELFNDLNAELAEEIIGEN